MAAPAPLIRPPAAHPGPNPAGTLHSQPHNGGPNSGLLQGSSHEPPRPQQAPVSAQPFFCLPVAPPPPFLHYQWPMPFSYNPFTSFPGMGYSMVMPPFPPPPPYMEAPAFVMPHAHVQPVDYRRLLHPPVHPPAAPYQPPSQVLNQSLNQVRRGRPPVAVRETVNSGVQTEPTQMGGAGFGQVSPLISSDSGHGTTANSPSSTSSHLRGSTEVENFSRGFNIIHPAEKQRCNVERSTGAKILHSSQQSKIKSLEGVSHCRSIHHNMWSVDSADSMVPVCSSSQQDDEVLKERRVSIPDILMSWATPQTTMLKRAEDQQQQCSPEHEVETHAGTDSASPDGTSAETLTSQDSGSLFRILRLPGALQELLSDAHRQKEPPGLVDPPSRYDLNQSGTGEGLENETIPLLDSSEMVPQQTSLNRLHMRRKLDESVWSVESLPPFIPNKEWQQQNGLFEPEATVVLDDCGGLFILSESLKVKRKEDRQSRRLSPSDSALMSESLLVFSTPAVKLCQSKTEMEAEMNSSEIREQKYSQSLTPLAKASSASPPSWQSRIVSSSPEEHENRSSEPEAHQGPNQEYLIETEQKRSSPEQDKTLSNSAEEENRPSSCGLMIKHGADLEAEVRACMNKELSEQKQQLCDSVDHHTTSAVSPSKGVDCGVQFPEKTGEKSESESQNSSGDDRSESHGSPGDVKQTKTRQNEGFSTNPPRNQKRNPQWRHRGQEYHHGQFDSYCGYRGKPGRSKGGNGRNRY